MSILFRFSHPTDRVAGTPSADAGTIQTGYEPIYATDWSDENIQRPCLFNELTGVRLKVAFGGTQRMDLIAVQHNLDAGVAFDIRTGATYAGATQIVNAISSGRRADGFTIKQPFDLTAEAGYSAGGFANLWVNVSGVNSAPIGLKVWVGSVLRVLTHHFDDSSWRGETDAIPSIVLSTDAGPLWAYQLPTNTRGISAQMSNAIQADLDLLRTWYRVAGGSALVSAMWPDSTKADLFVVRWLNAVGRDPVGVVKPLFDPVSVFGVSGISAIQCAWQEITAGLPEWS